MRTTLKVGLAVLLLALTLAPAYAQAPEGKEYLVQEGDWLSKIAAQEYGDPQAYPVIVEATNAKAAEDDSFAAIADPDLVKVGQKLWLPIADAASTPEDEAGASDGPLTLSQINNATYSGIYDEPVTLTDGQYEGEPFDEGGASRPMVNIVDGLVATGDLDGDGVDDAAVLLVENSGGSGVFTYLAAVLNQDGQPVNAGTVLVGDRTQIKSLAIVDGQIIMEIVTQGPDDPQCCPTAKMAMSYAVQGGELVELGSEDLGKVSLDDLMDTAWTLEYLDFDKPVLPDAPVTALFAESLVNGSASCNTYSASVSSDGGQSLTVFPAAVTRMACPEPVMDQETEYLAALQGSSQWSYYIGNLAISYQTADGVYGTLIFAPGVD